jgi:hypothetical protein
MTAPRARNHSRTVEHDRIAGAGNRRRPITLPTHPGEFASARVPPLQADATADEPTRAAPRHGRDL